MSIVPEIYHFPLSAALFSDFFLCQVLVIIEKILAASVSAVEQKSPQGSSYIKILSALDREQISFSIVRT